MRLVILCEGATEETVLPDFLAPYCTGFEAVKVSTPGGGDKLKSEFKQITEDILASEPDTYVFCLLDVFHAPFAYPRFVEQAIEPVQAKFFFIKDYMERQIDSAFQQRFFAFPVVMEVETWLLADTAPLNDYLKPATSITYHTPETVSHPAGELKKLFWQHKKAEYSKRVDGERLFKRANAQKVYEDNCPHFELLINRLRQLQGDQPADEPESAYQLESRIYREVAEQIADLEAQKERIYQDAESDSPTMSTDEALQKLMDIDEEIKAVYRQLNS